MNSFSITRRISLYLIASIINSTITFIKNLFNIINWVFYYHNFGTYDPQLDKTNKITCAPSEDSWLVPAFAQPNRSLRCLYKDSSGPWPSLEYTAKTDQTVRMCRLIWLSLWWAHISFCWFCHAPTHIQKKIQTKHMDWTGTTKMWLLSWNCSLRLLQGCIHIYLFTLIQS